MNNLVYNAIRTPDGTLLQSYNRHDYKTYVDANGFEYMVDGGLDYARRNVITEEPYEELSLGSDASHEILREVVTWGTRGRDGKEPLRWIAVKDMDLDHIQACLDTQLNMNPRIKQVFANELVYRNEV